MGFHYILNSPCISFGFLQFLVRTFIDSAVKARATFDLILSQELILS